MFVVKVTETEVGATRFARRFDEARRIADYPPLEVRETKDGRWEVVDPARGADGSWPT